jgi:NADH-quinone oxidoreductase subunit N
MNEFVTLMRAELVVTIIIFLLLFIKIGKGMSNEKLLVFIQIILGINFAAGLAINEDGALFGGLYHSDALIAVQKNILNLGVFLISLLFADWFKKSDQLAEFFILMLSALLGMLSLIHISEPTRPEE